MSERHADSAAAAVDRRPRAWLVDVRSGKALPIAGKVETTIGRLDERKGIFPDIDLTSFDPGRTSSRRHAEILRNSDGTLSVVDKAGATNGTYLNGTRLELNKPTALRRGDSLIFGTVWCRLQVEESPPLESAETEIIAIETLDVAAALPPRMSDFAFGMNENVEINGLDFHAQTEDLGWEQESILTVVYSSGAIVFTKKSPYSFFKERRGDDITPTQMVQFQHRSIVAGIMAGKYKEWFASTP